MTDDDDPNDLDENLEIGTSLPALRLREAAEWIVRAEPKLSTDTVHRNLLASIWNGEFDSGGLILGPGGKQSRYTRYFLGRVIYLMRPHHDDLDFQYRPAPLREPGPLWEGRLPDIKSDQADWEKLAAGHSRLTIYSRRGPGRSTSTALHLRPTPSIDGVTRLTSGTRRDEVQTRIE